MIYVGMTAAMLSCIGIAVLIVAARYSWFEEQRKLIKLDQHFAEKGRRSTCSCKLIFSGKPALYAHILTRRLGFVTKCQCGHAHETHQGHSGPNSIGQWFFGECVAGSSSIPPYRVGGCQCGSYRRFIRKTGMIDVSESAESSVATG